ncbi:leucine-rich repeat domain-containing protein [Ruminococcus flavefaciens]|uniref:leucine-rich repeat domain-containing protein n=1 Tax=Ruminococcus flavefaciens TaxID=1265 RepID=UPI00035F59F3|nr:leucine-rich repeat domain-containing protein [Ruminococcus flavefaciens]
MNYSEYKKIICAATDSECLKYKLAIAWLHPERIPVRITSMQNSSDIIIKIPCSVYNSFGVSVPVIAIGANAFKNCTSITDVILNTNIKTIESGAFSGCKALERIYIPKSVKLIRGRVFEGCTALKDIYYEGTLEGWSKLEKTTDHIEKEFGDLITGTPVQEIISEKLIRIPGNEALNLANIHFRCTL